MLLNIPKRGLAIQRMGLVKGSTKVTGWNLVSAIPGRQGHESDGTATHGFEFLVVPLTRGIRCIPRPLFGRLRSIGPTPLDCDCISADAEFLNP